MSDIRRARLTDWVNEELSLLLARQLINVELSVVSGDASFRRYFRANLADRSFIAVDAPPENENSELFVEIADYLRAAGVMSPEVYAQNFADGFLLLEDFGDQLYLPRLLKLQQSGLDSLSEFQVESLYREAIEALVKMQLGVDKERLAPYDRKKLREEMALFEEWFCGKFLGMSLSGKERELVERTFSFLEEAALSQPQLAVHRDYHSRNLLILDPKKYPAGSGPGIIDFQDAMAGGYSYDLVSLLRDCYIRWSPALVEKLALSYLERATAAELIHGITPGQFLRDFNLIGLQRNFKVMGLSLIHI